MVRLSYLKGSRRMLTKNSITKNQIVQKYAQDQTMHDFSWSNKPAPLSAMLVLTTAPSSWTSGDFFCRETVYILYIFPRSSGIKTT